MPQAYDEAVAHLKYLLAEHSTVKDFQAIEAKIAELTDLPQQVHQMKAYQQEAVLYQKTGKEQALAETDLKVDQLEKDLLELPIVLDYRQKMQDASDLLQYVTKSLEEKINEEILNGK
ncbi:YlbF family regulator [Streptococcus caprae]|uniref:YlbF family regulator n=1 Tax=Streptococcus caprae TaxID=1640501 RepID=A0ABV8CSH0_9STRE